MPTTEEMDQYFAIRDDAVKAFHAFAQAEPGRREIQWQRYVSLRERFLKLGCDIRNQVYKPLVLTLDKTVELRNMQMIGVVQ